jgi:3-hydroxyacyl-CoA dehydrogenase/enoyl-CoA hydratase/3-hydroxybutyryl-CoA epimerase
MTRLVLSGLGKTKLQLGPVAAHVHPRRRGGPDGIVWLVLDCKDTSTNTISRDVIEALDRKVQSVEDNPPKAVVIRSGRLC